MLISVRGTNGSGKSIVVRSLLDKYKGAPIYGLLGIRKPEAYQLTIPQIKKPIFILGSYHTVSGGVDQVQPYDLILDLINKYTAKGHVLFEGVIVSSSYGRVGRLMETWGQEAVMMFLTTSLEDCLNNVQRRRGARGDTRVFDSTNLISKYNSIAKSKEKIKAAGKLRIIEVGSKHAAKAVVVLLLKAK